MMDDKKAEYEQSGAGGERVRCAKTTLSAGSIGWPDSPAAALSAFGRLIRLEGRSRGAVDTRPKALNRPNPTESDQAQGWTGLQTAPRVRHRSTAATTELSTPTQSMLWLHARRLDPFNLIMDPYP
ncbi:hypothetical protein G7046_g2709 [Stylonectria norvegica]|nr:hypothetical protein G7046_g2709 [Stylonectria norvegica]